MALELELEFGSWSPGVRLVMFRNVLWTFWWFGLGVCAIDESPLRLRLRLRPYTSCPSFSSAYPFADEALSASDAPFGFLLVLGIFWKMGQLKASNSKLIYYEYIWRTGPWKILWSGLSLSCYLLATCLLDDHLIKQAETNLLVLLARLQCWLGLSYQL